MVFGRLIVSSSLREASPSIATNIELILILFMVAVSDVPFLEKAYFLEFNLLAT